MPISHHFHDCKAPLAGASHVKWCYAKYLGFSFFLDHNNTCLFISPLRRKLCTVFISVCLQDYLIKSCEFFFVKFWKMWALGQQTIDKIRIHHPDPNTGFFYTFQKRINFSIASQECKTKLWLIVLCYFCHSLINFNIRLFSSTLQDIDKHWVGHHSSLVAARLAYADHPCNIYRDCHRGVPRGGQNVP